MSQPAQTLHVLYHEIEPAPGPYLYTVSTAELDAHCALYRSLLDTHAPVAPRLTFDDGHRSMHDHALPVLACHSLRAHLFVTAGWTAQRAGYMDWQQLRAVASAGHRIGAHGWSHALLTRCTDAELARELVDARRLLEDRLGLAVTSLSFPGGRFDRRVLEHCRQAGYTELFTSTPRVARLPAELIGRVNLRQGLGTAQLHALFAPGSQSLRRLYLADRAKSFAKQLLGDDRYAQLWARLNHQSTADPSEPEQREPEPPGADAR